MPLLHRNVSKDAQDASRRVGCTEASRIPAHSASKTRVNALMLGIQLGPRFRGDERPGCVLAKYITVTIAASLRDRHRLRHLDTFAADPAAIGDGLDPHAARRVEGGAIGRVDVAGELEAPRRPDLDQEQ